MTDGSISARSSRTRCLSGWRRRMARGAAAGVLLLATRALAEWLTPITLPERPAAPAEPWSFQAFSLSVTTPSGGGDLYFLNDALSRSTVTPGVESAGSYFRSGNDCLITLRRFTMGGSRIGATTGNGACTGLNQNSPLTTGDMEVWWVRHVPGNGAVAVAWDSFNAEPVALLSSSNIYDTNFNPVPLGRNTQYQYVPPSALVIGSQVYGLIATTERNADVYLVGSGSSVPMTLRPVAGSENMGEITSLSGFAAGSPAIPHVVVGTEGGLLQGFSSPAKSLRRVWSLDPGEKISGVSLNVAPGTGKGHGFGMALLRKGGVPRVLGAVPMEEDTLAGTQWKLRSLPPAWASEPLDDVSCVDAQTCVFTVRRRGATNLFIYKNASGPKLDPPTITDGATLTGGVLRLEEKKSTTLTFVATDRDDDPLRLMASGLSLGRDGKDLQAIVQSAVPGSGLLELKLTAGNVCEKNRFVGTLNARATDGLESQDDTMNTRVELVHTVDPEVPPVVFDADGAPVNPGRLSRPLRAGGPPLKLRMTRDTSSAGCELTPTWTPLEPDAPPPVSSGNLVTLEPPKLFCEMNGRDFHYAFHVRDEGERFNTADFIVHLEPNPKPLAQGAFGLRFDAQDQAVLTSDGLDCLPERNLRATLEFEPVGTTGATLTETVPVPVTWPLPPSLGCGAYRTTATLTDDTKEKLSPIVVERPGRRAGLSLPEASALKVQCDAPASASIVATLPEDSCQVSKITWTQEPLKEDEGEEARELLEMSTLDAGRTLTVLTRAGDPLEALVGRTVKLRATADSGFGPPVTREHTLSIGVDPFVKVRRRTETPAASETGLVGVSVELLNETACAVDGVVHTEVLRGLSYVGGSARFNGVDLEDTDAWTSETGTLTLKGLRLEGGGKGMLTYVARPHLVGERSMEGTVSLNDTRVSLPENDGGPPESSCGCSGASSGPLLMALGALAFPRRRRR